MMEGCIDLTGAAGAAQRGGAGKRPASPTTGLCDARTQKRSKDTFGEALVNTRAGQPLPSRAQPRPKRGLSDDDSLIAHDTCLAGEPAGNGGWRTGGAGSGGDGQRVLQASDLENSVASISGALRWRSPAKPHKLPRLLGPDQSRLPGLPTAVRGIVDVGADHPDHDDEQHHLHHQQGAVPVGASCQQHGNPQHPQHPHPHQRRHAQRGADSTACGARGGHSHQPAAGSGGGGDLSPGQPQPAPSQPPQSPAPAPQQHHEWGQLFSSLSLGGAGRGSQRTDPVWAAASSNRAAGGAGTRRPAVPDLRTSFRPLPGAPSLCAWPSLYRDAPGATQQTAQVQDFQDKGLEAESAGDGATATHGSADWSCGDAGALVDVLQRSRRASPSDASPEVQERQRLHYLQQHQQGQHSRQHQQMAPGSGSVPGAAACVGSAVGAGVGPSVGPTQGASHGSRATAAPTHHANCPAQQQQHVHRQAVAAPEPYLEQAPGDRRPAAAGAAGGAGDGAAGAQVRGQSRHEQQQQQQQDLRQRAQDGGCLGGAVGAKSAAAGPARTASNQAGPPPWWEQQQQQTRAQPTQQGSQQPPRSQKQQQRQGTASAASPAGSGARGRAGRGAAGRGGARTTAAAGGAAAGAGRARGRGVSSSQLAAGPSQAAAGAPSGAPPAAPTVTPALSRDAKCPICGSPFPARMSNAEVNTHVDACVLALSDM